MQELAKQTPEQKGYAGLLLSQRSTEGATEVYYEESCGTAN